jgi:hypothetical protein
MEAGRALGEAAFTFAPSFPAILCPDGQEVCGMQDQVAALERQHWLASRHRLEAATADPALRRQARRMLWEVCQVLHDRDAALAHLQAAIDEDPLFTQPSETGRTARRSVLVLAVPGDFQANLPLDRLFDDSTALHTLWLRDPEAILRDPAGAVPAHLPPVDCVFIAIAEDAHHGAALLAADVLAKAIGRPVINRGGRIAGLSRTGTAALLRDLPDAVVPSHHLVERGERSPVAFPIIIRPLGSHAGQKLERVADDADLDRYYAAHEGVHRFTVAPFVDYRSEDGSWRKYRVIFVDGVAYPLHLAIHDDWAVWYYNAGMLGCEVKQAEERRFLKGLATAFPSRAVSALQAVGRRIALDYFGLDCSVMPDGQLLVFEVETGMIVHERAGQGFGGTDDPSFRIRQALERLIDRRCDKLVS